MDNRYLNLELKNISADIDVLMEQYKIGMTLLAMSVIQGKQSDENVEVDGDDTEAVNVAELVNEFTSLIAPVILPMINELGVLKDLETPVPA